MNYFSKSTRPFPPAELEQIRAIAYHLGTAIGNARLFWQLTRRTRELTKANQAKDEFLGVISHELRTPLNVILGYTDIMKQNMAGDLTPQALAMVSKVQGQAQALSTLVESILVTTQIEAGTIKTVVSEVNLAEFLLQLGSLFEPPREKNVRLIWNLPAELPTIWTDRTKLQRVLQNLIDNAIKFTDEGRITVSVHFLEDEEKISFVVEDTGVGIPQRDVAQVFDMFRQGDSSTTRSHDGVGLGLYIVKKFTELLHGTVELTSQPGRGSIFTVKIPRNPQSLTK
jgi:signal transduction histidine kinase